jgi:hypothetical protein
MSWDLVEFVIGFYWVLRWYVSMSITDAQYSVLGSPNGSISCQDDILKDLLKKMTRTYPLGALNIELFPALTKIPCSTCYFELSSI